MRDGGFVWALTNALVRRMNRAATVSRKAVSSAAILIHKAEGLGKSVTEDKSASCYGGVADIVGRSEFKICIIV